MSKTRIFALIIIVIMLAAIVTNPKEETFYSAVKEKATLLVEKQLNYEHRDALDLGMTLFGNRIVDEFVENNVKIKNYYLFSVVSLKWQGEETPIGGGAFKKIWFSSKIDEKAEEIVDILKTL
ncbi:hypothetical protein FAZ19_00410 [Sphingobacterium alkalisoli]|uniref:DUF4359 domain-containing protein n=1 Tax=Sphingobacterium alkalisoli TaxID=1874115 RepID=A0A4U0H7M9_9SPHI|nr:hypothetical protein [Sphingobacterium alkalisoli]TJY67761.1 hypothetical protein FAZ19_00410 [Sphingobacterium alkalisoli]GGH11542.1 hypothetical protein GCM10011418_10460 [Sphingobacterium alkalisoli]